MATPLVSIGMPVYNGERFIREAIESILSQDYEDFELIISDNGSDDRTAEICQTYRAADARVRLFREEKNRGAAWNYNRVFQLSTGSFFKWQAHDDVCLPGFLSRCVRTFDQAGEDAVLVHPHAEVIDSNGVRNPRFSPETLETHASHPHQRLAVVLRRVNMACAIFGLIRSSALRETQLIGPFIAADYVLLAELAVLGAIWEVPEVLFQRRVHPKISTYANPSARELLAWYDPSVPAYNPILPPLLSLGKEYLASISRLPLTNRQRWRCRLTVMSVWYERQLRILGGRQKARVQRSFRKFVTRNRM